MMTDDRSPGMKGSSPQPVTVTTTRTTTTSSPAINLDWIVLNKDYFRSIPGILKIVQIVLGILCMILGSPALYLLKGTDFFLFVVVVSFILTLLWIFIYLLSVRENLQTNIPWLSMEFYATLVSAAFYFIAMVVEFATTSGYSNLGSYTAAAVFALFNTIAYVGGAFFVYKEWKGIPMATTTTTTSVA